MLLASVLCSFSLFPFFFFSPPLVKTLLYVRVCQTTPHAMVLQESYLLVSAKHPFKQYSVKYCIACALLLHAIFRQKLGNSLPQMRA